MCSRPSLVSMALDLFPVVTQVDNTKADIRVCLAIVRFLDIVHSLHTVGRDYASYNQRRCLQIHSFVDTNWTCSLLLHMINKCSCATGHSRQWFLSASYPT
ncbi:hypothetical protein BKA56DRAFT_252099 [Ilyonectria sp. MPI-CAGE-AT-0026]|nr:hypothetical protein BKA56DRAFT_252099 [Ilyonectria sp. MPI-CAGE-AT-0026]